MARRFEITRPERWDNPFGSLISEADVNRILALPFFQDINPEVFPDNLNLRDIIRNDARVVQYDPGDVILRRGAYGNSVFIIVVGSVRVIDGALEHEITGAEPDTAKKRRQRYVEALSTLWRNSGIPERRRLASPRRRSRKGEAEDDGQQPMLRLEEFQSIIAGYPTVQLCEGQIFGEAAALTRAPHAATVFAETAIQLVELRWQGLRDLRHWDEGFRQRLDKIYRDESLKKHLRECAVFESLNEETLDLVAANTRFESHGEVEWANGFKRAASGDINDVIDSEPVIASQDGYIDDILVIRMGFGRITERLDRGHRTVGFLSQNEVFGLAELIDYNAGAADLRYRLGLRAVGYVDVLRIPSGVIEQHVLPTLRSDGIFGALRRKRPRRHDAAEADGLDESMLNFLVNNRTINGTEVMVIDTDRCTGCDDCVRACASAHDNNPRFVRAGPMHANVMVASACMHCTDPVCLIGCPTGAIHRTTDGGLVVIDDSACIGCTICANSCPYDNIRMVEIRNPSGKVIVDEATNTPILKATKCDLCVGRPGGPACVRACPHDALIRINVCDRDALSEWINRS